MQDQDISTVKAAIRRGKNENLVLKNIKAFEEYIKETLDLELKDKSMDYRFVYGIHVDDIPRQKVIGSATKIKKTFFVQSCAEGIYKSQPHIAKSRAKHYPAHTVFREAVCVCEPCFIYRNLKQCENAQQTRVVTVMFSDSCDCQNHKVEKSNP